MNIAEIENQLCHRSHEEIDRALDGVADHSLIDLLDSKFAKIGDTAAELLSRRKRVGQVIDAVLSDEISTKSGKLRAINIVTGLGITCERSRDVYLKLLYDKSTDVAHSALFGLVFLQDCDVVPEIQTLMQRMERGNAFYDECIKAIEALESQDPFIFSPYFHDIGNVWELDPQRFSNRIGPM